MTTRMKVIWATVVGVLVVAFVVGYLWMDKNGVFSDAESKKRAEGVLEQADNREHEIGETVRKFVGRQPVPDGVEYEEGSGGFW